MNPAKLTRQKSSHKNYPPKKTRLLKKYKKKFKIKNNSNEI